ncbi:MAG: DUF1295 domain-containing protein [Rhizobiaceae bacterium]
MSLPLAATFLASVLAFTGIWLIQVRLKDAGLVDYYWGPGFLVIALVHGWLGGFTVATATLTLLVAFWSMRLSWHLVVRHQKSSAEDARYAAMRSAGGTNFWWKSLFTVFLLQAVLQWIIALPLHAAFLHLQTVSVFNPLFIFGLLVFLAGFAFETIADRQLAHFKQESALPGRLMTSGLWALSRHPNYLGEMILWFGLGVCVFAMNGSALALAGPVILAFIIVAVSIPLTEDHLSATRPAFEAYAARTPMLLPRLAALKSFVGA